MTIITSECIEFAKNGDPNEVLTLGRRLIDTSKIDVDEVIVRWLASPVNPLDINIVSGTYAFKLPLPAVAGSEAVGVVEEIGTNVRNVGKGDRVILFRGQEGWSQFTVVNADYLLRIDARLDLVSAATLSINPPTAYLMLKTFVDLSRGDFVIQNAANSGVGRAVIQIAKEFGYRTINLVRQRDDLDALKRELKELGADFIFSEAEFTPQFLRKFLHDLDGNVKLALNGVGGRSALLISSTLDNGGTMVTYGGMSKRPSEISTTALVYKNIRAVGINVGMQFLHSDANVGELREMFDALQQMILFGRLRPVPAQFHALQDFRDAIRCAVDGRSGKKQIILLQDEDSSFYKYENLRLKLSKL